jgi:L-ascorbate metabolism protein UlaG (beta-lactamase superfamily)
MDLRGNSITWMGHASFRITTADGRTVLIDPWISGPTCPEKEKTFSRVDLLLFTHAHWDHFADALTLCRQYTPRTVVIIETGQWLESKGISNVIGMNKGGTVNFDGIEVTMVHAVHSNSIVDEGRVVYAGEPAGFVVRLPGGLTLYHAGDTAVFGDMRLIGELYRPELALLPIGDHFTMGPREAAQAVRLLGARHVVPMHYGTFPLLTGTPEAFQREVAAIAGLQVHVLQPGQSLG